ADIYTLSLHDALPILDVAAIATFLDQILHRLVAKQLAQDCIDATGHAVQAAADIDCRALGQPGMQALALLAQQVLHVALVGLVRSEEHTSELQSRENL